MPVFFLLSPGVNPDADVKVLGNGLGKTEDEGKFIRVSLGQGQDIAASKGGHTMRGVVRAGRQRGGVGRQ